ncbi:MAG: LCP family protein [bacterium]|nr:LCP family protein [bacterium]
MEQIKPLRVSSNNKKFWLSLIGKHKTLTVLLTLLLLGFLWWTSPTTPSVFNFVLGKESFLETENDQVNILLLGTGGGDHEGPNLTDTIIVTSYNMETHEVNLVSLPRDLWVDQYKVKINALYQLGLDKDQGPELVKEQVGQILGLKIPYTVRVDFQGFTKAIDLVGGIEVEVARSFDDYYYPLKGKEKDLCGYSEGEVEVLEDQAKSWGVAPGKLKALLDPSGKVATVSAAPDRKLTYTDEQANTFFACRFEHLSFKKGSTFMNGETALKFVRSRHGLNGEGSDFARSRRQQQVIQSFKSKVLSLGTLTDPRKVIELVSTFGDSIESNISPKLYPELLKLVPKTGGVKSYAIDGQGEDPLLVTPPLGDYGAWVLVPAGGDYSKIHQYVKDILSGTLEGSESAKPK